jgi:signal transduction histidine kinase
LTLILGPAERLLQNESSDGPAIEPLLTQEQRRANIECIRRNSLVSRGRERDLFLLCVGSAVSFLSSFLSSPCLTYFSQVLLRHVNDLLDVAKLDSGSMSAQFELVQPIELLRLVAANFEVLASERNVNFEVREKREERREKRERERERGRKRGRERESQKERTEAQ